MKILHINTFDTGGAAIACFRLHQQLLRAGHESKVLVLHKSTGNVPGVYGFTESASILQRIKSSLKYRWNQYRIKKLINSEANYEVISFPWAAFDIIKNPLIEQSDIIHLHWVGNFLDYNSFFKRISKPVIWTLHDMNPFSGLFHYTKDLEKNRLIFEKMNSKALEIKFQAIKQCKQLTVVVLSNWMLGEVKKSKILGNRDIHHIPNGIDLTKFKPHDKMSIRRSLKLPLDKKLILFVADNADNERKGMRYLIDAVNNLKSDAVLCVLGELSNKQLPQQILHLGFIHDQEKLSEIYSAMDLFIIPSIEDNQPNTVVEAMSCGLPSVGFNSTGIKDLISARYTGQLADLEDVNDLATKIDSLLEDQKTLEKMGANARKMAENQFDIKKQAIKYIDLYQKNLGFL